MKTQIHNRLDLRKYLDPLDPARLPGGKEIDEAVMKRLTKSHIVLSDLSAGEAVQAGDTVTLRLESALPKFNKAKLPITVGTGLYDKELEAALIGKAAGERGAISKNGENVSYELLSAKRKTVPAPTDAMAAEQGIEGVDTVEKFRAHLGKEMLEFATYQIVNGVTEAMLADAETDEPAEEEIDRLEFLEADFITRMRLADQDLPEEELKKATQSFMEEQRASEYYQGRREFYANKVRVCLALGSALEIPLEGKYDPMAEYLAMSDLTVLLAQKIEEDLLRRKN